MAENLIDFAQELKRKISIDLVVADYVPNLKRTGRTWKCCCPFHEEKTPSFNVNPEHGFYHCFGCGVSGDAIKFVQEFEKVDFRVAVEQLARRFQIPIPEFSAGSPEQRDEAQKTREALLGIAKLAHQFFVEQLANNPAATPAWDYLIHKRGLTREQVLGYGIGYAPEEWEGFLAVAARRGYGAERVAEAGLAVARDTGGYYDRFRHRIMFPIADQKGNVVGFGGRILEGDGPKYVNSSDSPIFHKGKLLYGLSASREAIRETGKVVLLEGYMDWIALHSHGIQNVLAGMGTALAEDQARWLKRITGEVVLQYDGDSAGRKAAFRAATLLLPQGLDVKVAELPAEHDPDSFLRERGTAAARAAIENAKPALDFFTDDAMRQFPVGSPEGKFQIADTLAPLLNAIADPILQEGYQRHIAARLGLDFGTLKKGLNKRAMPAMRREIASHEDPDPDEPPAYIPASKAIDRREQNLLNVLINHLERADFFEGLEAKLFLNPVHREIYSRVYGCALDLSEGGTPPENWLSICASEHERQAMGVILCFESQVAGGELRADVSPHSSAKAAALVKDLRHLLQCEFFKRERREVRASATLGGCEDNILVKDRMHHLGSRIVRDNLNHFGGPAEAGA